MDDKIPAEELDELQSYEGQGGADEVRSLAFALKAAYAEIALEIQQSKHYRERLAGEQMTRVTYGHERDTLKARVVEAAVTIANLRGDLVNVEADWKKEKDLASHWFAEHTKLAEEGNERADDAEARVAELEKGLRELKVEPTDDGESIMFVGSEEELEEDTLNARIDALLPRKEKNDA